MKYTWGRSLRAMGALAAIVACAANWSSAAIITGVTVSGGDAAITNTGGRTAQRENEIGSVISLFGEDKPVFLDRNHQHNGARFNAAGTLTTTAVAGDTIIGLPSYLVGGEYLSTMQSHRDNAQLRIDVTVGPAVDAYLLIDNRVGETPQVNTTPPTLGAVMAWVAADGWVMQNTGISPLGQPDFTGVDEGSTITDFNNRPNADALLGVGPGVSVQQFFTVFKKSFPAGATINLKEQNFGGINMYSMVVQQVPEPSSVALLGLGAVGLAWFKLRRTRRAA